MITINGRKVNKRVAEYAKNKNLINTSTSSPETNSAYKVDDMEALYTFKWQKKRKAESSLREVIL